MSPRDLARAPIYLPDAVRYISATPANIITINLMMMMILLLFLLLLLMLFNK